MHITIIIIIIIIILIGATALQGPRPSLAEKKNAYIIFIGKLKQTRSLKCLQVDGTVTS
jgi:hypothetical protein